MIEKRLAMRNIRANESDIDNKERKVLNSLSMSKKRSLESDSEALSRGLLHFSASFEM